MTPEEHQYRVDNRYGWQVDRPVFIKVPFNAFGKSWTQGEHFNWINQNFRGDDWQTQLDKVANLFNQKFLHHDSAREQTNKVGDRLSELNGEQLYRLIQQLNAEVKDRTSSTEEFNKKKCKISKIDDKQRGLIRQWLRRNPWAHDLFYEKRDYILGE